MIKPTSFSTLAEAISAATYIQQLLTAEYQWISNRLSWLFISQSFCISAYTTLASTSVQRFEGHATIYVLQRGLPVFGISCCIADGLAVFAARRVAHFLAEERARVVHYINENSPASIPLIGFEGDLKDHLWLHRFGELPHWVLPWLLGIFWLLLISL